MDIEIEKCPRVVGLSKLATSDTHGEDSPYFARLKAYDENPFDEVHNPFGVIQMGLAENQVSYHHLATVNSTLDIELENHVAFFL